jgi:hypothetical protein
MFAKLLNTLSQLSFNCISHISFFHNFNSFLKCAYRVELQFLFVIYMHNMAITGSQELFLPIQCMTSLC